MIHLSAVLLWNGFEVNKYNSQIIYWLFENTSLDVGGKKRETLTQASILELHA